MTWRPLAALKMLPSRSVIFQSARLTERRFLQNRRSSWLLSAVVLGTVALWGCVTSPAGREHWKQDLVALQHAPGETWLRTELYFGLNKRDGQVSESEWQSFLEEVVTPRFPQGLTFMGGFGQWQDQFGKIQHESSRLLILLHGPDRSVDDQIEQVRQIYCARFQQESVLRVTSLARVSFTPPAGKARTPARAD